MKQNVDVKEIYELADKTEPAVNLDSLIDTRYEELVREFKGRVKAGYRYYSKHWRNPENLNPRYNILAMERVCEKARDDGFYSEIMKTDYEGPTVQYYLEISLDPIKETWWRKYSGYVALLMLLLVGLVVMGLNSIPK